jgi:formylglycine-generating enzyme required for sulfatase activity
LEGAANVLDQTGGAREPQFGTPELFDDRFTTLSPVGTFRANPFGLFDVHGNAWEWCRDRGSDYALSARAGDGLRAAPRSAADRVVRGGGYQSGGFSARSSHRASAPPSSSWGYLGLRPSRSLHP